MTNKRRRRTDAIAIRCQVCGWVDGKSTWRQAKAALRTHQETHARGWAV